MVKFCPRCGGLMRPQKESGRSFLVCSRCGYKEEAASNASLKMSSRIEHGVKEKMVIIGGEENVANLPITRDVTCKRCGAQEAYYWVLQTRAADEPPTRFYKCVKCGYVWREYE
mgnify:CR=1 FL=1